MGRCLLITFDFYFGELRGLRGSMITNIHNYNLFFKFIETYTPSGFQGIDPDDPLMVELERIMEMNDEFLYIADAIQMNIHFTSKGSLRILGIPPDELSFYHFMEATHPNDIQRLNLGRAKILKICQELFIAERGSRILSTNYRILDYHPETILIS